MVHCCRSSSNDGPSLLLSPGACGGFRSGGRGVRGVRGVRRHKTRDLHDQGTWPGSCGQGGCATTWVGAGEVRWPYQGHGVACRAGRLPGAARGALRAQRSRRQYPNWRRRPCRSGCSRSYCGCGSDRRLLSSCISTATLASALACSRPWCAQKSSSPELASSTRTYAWAPHRSQTSSAVSGLVGAIAPVNVAYLRVVPPAYNIRLAPVFCPYSSAQHIPRRQRSPLPVVYATSETTHRRSVAVTAGT